jgi:serine carboxypeptidase-like clade 2
MIEPLNFNMYSGYIQVDQEFGKQSFYWFVESQRDPQNDPVLIWMNGGRLASIVLLLSNQCF